jgi:hypothetical protein
MKVYLPSLGLTRVTVKPSTHFLGKCTQIAESNNSVTGTNTIRMTTCTINSIVLLLTVLDILKFTNCFQLQFVNIHPSLRDSTV